MGDATNLGMTILDHPYEAQLGGLEFYIPDEVLLSARVCDLGVRLEETRHQHLTAKLLKEIKHAHIEHIVPKFYLADEWFCPDGSTAIAIPIWLAHPRLMQLERSLMGRVEGETANEFMMLLRHEMGHCIEHAYKLSKNQDWKNIFGNPAKKYTPESYEWNKESRDFVRHLPDGYAQSHPEEDFAETFAVWLDPKSRWKSVYRNWEGAYAKLNYVDAVIKKLGPTKPRRHRNSLISMASRTKKTLREVYQTRLRELKRTDLPFIH